MYKKPTGWHFALFFISPLQVAQHVSSNHVPKFRSWRLRSVITSCATNSSMDTLLANRFWQPSCSHGIIPTRGDKTTQSSAPEDGHMFARNMLSNL